MRRADELGTGHEDGGVPADDGNCGSRNMKDDRTFLSGCQERMKYADEGDAYCMRESHNGAD